MLAIAGGWWGYANWQSRQEQDAAAGLEMAESSSSATTVKIIVGDLAQKNLKLTAKPLKASSYWKTITVPGSIVDRPGVSDREVVAPAIGTVSEIRLFPGDTVRPGEVLFTLKLASDSLHETQANLFKANQEIKQAGARLEKLRSAGEAIAQARVTEVENEIKQLEVAAKADTEQLRQRGLSAAEIDGVANGKLVSEISVVAPKPASDLDSASRAVISTGDLAGSDSDPSVELQELKVDVGQQVQAGQTLCILSDHQRLAIEGRAFRDETPLLENSLQKGWPVEVDFQESAAADWPPIEQTFLIRRVANTIDPATRTFSFLLPLENQSKTVQREHGTQRLWRFRPGQKLWLHVRVEEVENVFVLPKDAVAWDGPEAFVFTQNVNTFEREGVHVLHQDRDRVVIANDGSLPAYRRNDELLTIPAVVQNAAAQLNRMTKSGSGDVPVGYHIHADGSLHKNEDEGK